MMSDAESVSDDYIEYYNANDYDEHVTENEEKNDDPEYFHYDEFQLTQVIEIFKNIIAMLSQSLKINSKICEYLLSSNAWNEGIIKRKCEQDFYKCLAEAEIISALPESANNNVSEHTNLNWPLKHIIYSNSANDAVCQCCYLDNATIAAEFSTEVFDLESTYCLSVNSESRLYSLLCGQHFFCIFCWRQYLHHQVFTAATVQNNVSHGNVSFPPRCMGHSCRSLVPSQFVQWILSLDTVKCDDIDLASFFTSQSIVNCNHLFQKLFTNYLIKTHPYFRSCPSPNCNAVFRAITPLVSKREFWFSGNDLDKNLNSNNMAHLDNQQLQSQFQTTQNSITAATLLNLTKKNTSSSVSSMHESSTVAASTTANLNNDFRCLRIHCSSCDQNWCFQCGSEYHAPTTCATLLLWTKKCLDDSETANYISAHTKDCPRCHVCIEKSGGCNHMICTKCGFDFCWMCLNDWSQHSAEYYECSRYRENPNIVNEAQNMNARKALKKYIFYFGRWANHEKSLGLEHEQTEQIKRRINEKVNKKEGTWIDWQYLLNASKVLRNCRNTLKHTYPFAFYMNRGPHKDLKELFEYKQGLLEAEVENLSWKIQHVEIHERGGLELQMDVCEKHRKALLHEFYAT